VRLAERREMAVLLELRAPLGRRERSHGDGEREYDLWIYDIDDGWRHNEEPE
jgi:hypothetical protein